MIIFIHKKTVNNKVLILRMQEESYNKIIWLNYLKINCTYLTMDIAIYIYIIYSTVKFTRVVSTIPDRPPNGPWTSRNLITMLRARLFSRRYFGDTHEGKCRVSLASWPMARVL